MIDDALRALDLLLKGPRRFVRKLLREAVRDEVDRVLRERRRREQHAGKPN